jgi:hypothetical protein
LRAESEQKCEEFPLGNSEAFSKIVKQFLNG